MLRLHISKREEYGFVRALLVRVAAVTAALLICAGLIYSLTGLNPLQVYRGIIDGAVGTNRRLWETIRDALVLLLISVAITPAFKMRFWNIGAEGQVLIGALGAAAVMITQGETMAPALLYPLMVAAAVAAGCLWGFVPAAFKAVWNTNETLFTLMMNYIATQLVAFFVIFWENPVGSSNIGIINQMTQSGWLPQLFGLKYGWNLIIVVAVTLFMYVYLRYSKQGYEIAYVGQSVNTARYAGISVKKVILRTMAISGAICGLTGFLLVSGVGHTLSVSISGGRGFTAIVVAWLSKLNTITMMFTAFLLAFLEHGAIQIASQFSLNTNFSDIVTGIILFCVLGCEFFLNFKVEIRRVKKEARK